MMNKGKIIIFAMINIILFLFVLKGAKINADLRTKLLEYKSTWAQIKTAESDLPKLRKRVAEISGVLEKNRDSQTFSSIVDALASVTYVLEEQDITPVSLSQKQDGTDGVLSLTLNENFVTVVKFLENLVNGDKLYRIKILTIKHTSEGLVSTMDLEVALK